ncbi:MAG TPA: response regulator [Candidatus Sulfotelmatobacter sp.]|nr:response regulator [Candidatus Sulfotelmatobacter sp.]
MDKATKASRILIVEDDPTSAKLLEELLATDEYHTEVAASGPEALGRARRGPPDLILLDVRMPDMDGFEVCRQLKADARTAAVPVLMVTALDNSRDKEEGLNAGADDYVTKPINPVDVVTRVRSLIRVSHLNQELDRALAYLRELEVARRAAAPAAACPGAGPGGWEEAVSAKLAAPTEGTAPAVLLVDDDRLIRELYGKLLAGAGYRVITAAGAAEAYAAAARGVDVILLDVMMPEVSGLEALERLRQTVPEVPILILTAYQTAQNAIAALRGGAFDFIVKGLKREMLLNAVARAVERRHLTLENRRLMEELRARLDATLASPAAPAR